jgi:hypothetical protein
MRLEEVTGLLHPAIGLGASFLESRFIAIGTFW